MQPAAGCPVSNPDNLWKSPLFEVWRGRRSPASMTDVVTTVTLNTNVHVSVKDGDISDLQLQSSMKARIPCIILQSQQQEQAVQIIMIFIWLTEREAPEPYFSNCSSVWKSKKQKQKNSCRDWSSELCCSRKKSCRTDGRNISSFGHGRCARTRLRLEMEQFLQVLRSSFVSNTKRMGHTVVFCCSKCYGKLGQSSGKNLLSVWIIF